MIRTIVVDKNEQSRNVVCAQLSNNENVELINSFCALDEIKEVNDIDLIVFDVDLKSCDDTLNIIKNIQQQNANIYFIALSYEISSSLASLVLNSGINDFLLKPVISSILETSIKKIFQREPKKAKVISVFSNKGGIGKTSVVVNVANEIAKKTQEKVCILDLSFNSEDAGVFLDIEQKFDIDYIMSKIETSNEELLLSLMGKYKNSNLYCLQTQTDLTLNVKFSTSKIIKIINLLKNIFDYVLIDMSSNIDESMFSILNNSDLVFLLALENMSSIRNCQKCYELFDKAGYGDDKIKLIINRHIENQEISLEDIEKSTGKKVFGIIPNNYLTLIDAINLGSAVGDTNPQSNIAKAYAKIADEILKFDFSVLKAKNIDHGIFNLLQKMGE